MTKIVVVRLSVAVAIFGAILSGAYAQELSGKCSRAWFTEKPRWVASALARQEAPPLILIDPAQNRLLAYDQDGNSIPLHIPDTIGEVGFLPTAINQAAGDDFLIELVDGTIVQLDHKFSPIKVVLSPQAKAPGSLRIGSLYQWRLANNYLIAYGSLLDANDEPWKGFFRVPLNSASQTPEKLRQLPDSAYYLIGNSYITTIGAISYYVAMEKSPAIFMVSPEGGRSKRLSAFPEDFRIRPDLVTKSSGPKSSVARFAEIEKLSLVSGLFSQDGFLYLLTRSPALRGTQWRLYKIDPVGDKLAASIELPTNANHLSVAVSKTNWFFVEKGEVQAVLRQEIDSMLVLDESDILRARKFPAICPAKGKIVSRRDFIVAAVATFIGLTLTIIIKIKGRFLKDSRGKLTLNIAQYFLGCGVLLGVLRLTTIVIVPNILSDSRFGSSVLDHMQWIMGGMFLGVAIAALIALIYSTKRLRTDGRKSRGIRR